VAPPPINSFEQLQAQLRSPDQLVRQGAANQLGQLGDPRAVPALIRSLNGDGEARVRAAAALALGALRAGGAAPHLSRACGQDPDPQVREAAHYALSQLGYGGQGAPVQPLTMDRRQLQRYLMDTDPEYASARGKRTGGIVLASVGGGLGLVIGLTAALVFAICEDTGSYDYYGGYSTSYNPDCDAERNWIIGGFVGAAVSLAVGLPLAISGHRRAKEILLERIQGRAPQVSLRLDRQGGGGQLGLTWAF